MASFLLCLISFPAQAEEWSLDMLSLPGGVESIFRDRDRTIVESRSGAFFELRSRESRVTVDRLGSYRRAGALRRPQMLPDGVVVESTGAIREAYLTRPTSRYRHGVLGDSIEALGLRIVTSDGDTLDVDAGSDAVFEDLAPRLVDLTDDGREEIVVVRSSIDGGASTVVFAVGEGTVSELASAEPIGRPNRWLNPVGAADFDADGRLEIAVVRTPHIGGILILYELQGNELVEEHRARGFSNHFIGSRDLGLSLIADLNGDGVADIGLPSADRAMLRMVSFAQGQFVELASIPLPARIRTNIVRLDDGGRSFAFGLADGSLASVRRN